MEAAIDRIMLTYDLLVNRTAAASARGARQGDGLSDHAVRGRRERYPSADRVRADLSAPLDGRNDPVKAGFTGL